MSNATYVTVDVRACVNRWRKHGGRSVHAAQIEWTRFKQGGPLGVQVVTACDPQMFEWTREDRVAEGNLVRDDLTTVTCKKCRAALAGAGVEPYAARRRSEP